MGASTRSPHYGRRVLGLSDIVSPPHKHILGLFGGSAPFLEFCLGAFLIFLSQRPSLRVGVLTAACGIGLEFYLASIRGSQGLSPYHFLLGTGLGLTAIVVQLFYMRCSVRADRHLLQNMLLLPGFIAASTSMIRVDPHSPSESLRCIGLHAGLSIHGEPLIYNRCRRIRHALL